MSRLSDLQFQLASFQARADARRREIEVTQAALAQAQDTLPRIERALSRAEASGDTARAAQAQTDLGATRRDIATLQNTLSREQANLAQTESAIRQAEADIAALESTPTPSAPSQPVQQQIQQQEPNNPIRPPPQTLDQGRIITPAARTAPSNAVTQPTQNTGDTDVNTNPPVRTLSQTQSVNTYTSQAISGPTSFAPIDPGEIPGVTVSDRGQTDPGFVPNGAINPGAGAQDDSGATSVQRTQAEANANGEALVTDGPITPQPNVLDRFANYTYQASVYMMTPAQLETFQNQNRKSVSGYNLLFQSGGAPLNQQGPQQPAGQPQEDGRNPYFDLDFYIDSITIENSLFGKDTGASHSVATLKFTVIEPNNITLIDRLYAAAQDLAPKDATGAINYAAVVYLMVIRFYGYDINGKIQRVGAADPRTGLTDADAMVEKFIPFRIKFINWSVGSKLVTYEFDCAPQDQLIALGTRRGSIPADVEISGATVETMLSGARPYTGLSPAAATPGASTSTQPNQSDAETLRLARQNAAASAATPGNASAAPSNGRKSIKQGLITAMNEYQQQLVQKGIYNYADEYEIVFANGAEAIAAATVTKPAKKVNKKATPAAPAPSRQPSSASPDKQSMDTTGRNFGITAGMPVVQAIDLIIRNSNYITDQATVVIDESTGQPVPNPKSNTRGMRWFNILMQATQLQYDEKRNDFAYRVRYIIVPYTPQDFTSLYFPPAQFRGVHKRYPWWFTGENTQVLDYTATFNNLYSLTVTAATIEGGALDELRKKQSSSMRDIPFYQYQARSTESEAGAGTKANEVAANAAEYLYNPSDNAEAKVRILGDPAWIQQGSITGGVSARSLSYQPFEPDGSINFDTNDVMFEIVWQKPEDYDTGTGLADPYGKTQKTFGDRQPIQSVVYRTRSVTSEFRGGKFEQVLNGTLYTYPIPEGTNTAPGAPAAAEPDQRLPGANQQDVSPGGLARAALPTSTSLASAQLSSAGAARIGQNTLAGFSNLTGAVSQINAAKFTNYATPSTLLASATQFSPTIKPGEFSSLIPQGIDNVLPAAPAGPVTSNGAEVTEQDLFEAESIARSGGDATPDQVAANRRLNAILSGSTAVPKLRGPNTDVLNNTQDMARET
jgi:hypothetical protein